MLEHTDIRTTVDHDEISDGLRKIEMVQTGHVQRKIFIPYYMGGGEVLMYV